MSTVFSAEFEADAGRGDEHGAVPLVGGDEGEGRIRRAALGLLRPRQLGSGHQRKRPGASLQGPHEDLEALLEPLQEGRTEELLRGPAGEDRLLQWTGMLNGRKHKKILFANIGFKNAYDVHMMIFMQTIYILLRYV